MADTYRKIFQLLDRGERRRFVLLMLMILVMGLLDVAGVASILPFLGVLADPQKIGESVYLSFLYNSLGFESERGFLVALGAGVFTVVLSGIVFKGLTLYALIRFSHMRNYSISVRLLRSYLSKPYVWFLRQHSADLGKKVLSEVALVTQSSILPAMNLAAHATVVLALTILLLAVDAQTTMVAIVVMGGAFSGIYLGVKGLLARIGRLRVEANSARYKLASELMGGVKDVKLRGLERTALERFSIPNLAFSRSMATSAIVGQIPRYLLEAVAFGGMLVFVLMMLARHDGRVADLLPVLGLFAFAGVRMFPAMQQVYVNFTALRFGQHALDALHNDLIDAGSEGLCASAPAPLGLCEGLELRGVHYMYPEAGRAALNGLTLTVAANTTVGVVGGSGAGKTTFVDVVLGLLVPQKGSLIVDGVEILDQNRQAWQRSVGYVPQQIFLVDDTVVANIAFGIAPDHVDQAAVERAARIADIHGFVTEELPDGYDTMVGERGVRLSGGQRQRIGIAHALYHDPAVLVFDEATSALDNVTERGVMDAVHKLAGAKTIIMVAHRLSTVARCDEIILLEDGQLQARGTYDELLGVSSRFRQLARGAS